MPLPFPYLGNLDWLAERTLLVVRHGSRAYGTATPRSDEDYKGVCVPPERFLHGFASGFEQAEQREPVDAVIYELRKFFRLAAECNPSVIEILHVADDDVLLETPLGARLRARRNAFLSRKARHTFSGYARAQLRRIRGHHEWLVSPPGGPPTRAAFGLPETSTLAPEMRDAALAAVRKQLDAWQLDLGGLDPAARIALENRLAERFADDDAQWRSAARLTGLTDNVIEALDRERRFKSAQRRWQQFREWKAERNPERAALEAQHGFDTKHAMHLVRLLRMAHEIVETGRVIVRRPDASELLAIRDGQWGYELLVEYAERMDRELDAKLIASPLPERPDLVALDRLCVELVEQALAALRP